MLPLLAAIFLIFVSFYIFGIYTFLIAGVVLALGILGAA